MDLARRSFLRARTNAVPSPQRPPWALDEGTFTATCTRCGDCLAACPTGLLKSGPGNFPFADFSQSHCTFCGDCSRACAPHAIAADISLSPWKLGIHIGDTCLTRHNVVCRTCGEICESGAIRFTPTLGGASQPVVDNDHCSGCGECISTCPSSAIVIERREATLPQESHA